MKLLRDTHVFLWLISGDARLPITFQDAIRDPANEAYLSVASIWEVVIKYGLGKLPLPSPPEDYLPAQRIQHQIASLSIDEGTIVQPAKLPLLHRDPFDRIIMAQAVQHGLTIASVDDAIRAYGLRQLA